MNPSISGMGMDSVADNRISHYNTYCHRETMTNVPYFNHRKCDDVIESCIEDNILSSGEWDLL